MEETSRSKGSDPADLPRINLRSILYWVWLGHSLAYNSSLLVD